MTRSPILLFAMLCIVFQGLPAKAASARQPEVKLVLQITVDGMRGDLIERYKPGLGNDGFAYLLKNGTVYTNAHYQHANTETIVGHSILATGTFPSINGMVGNVWFDTETNQLTYNIEDPKSPILPSRQAKTKTSQLDPAQKVSRTQGRSPSVILAATFSDTLKAFYAGKSKIFGVSGKDRGAVPMAGHTGKAFWYSIETGDFLTSQYYYDTYPDWAKEWNAKRLANNYQNKSWTLLNDKSTYLLADQDGRPYEIDLKGYRRVFPHPFGQSDHPLYYTRLLISPVGDQLTLDFSKALIENEQLGRDNIPDYLSISFSGVDAVNHFFGPSSLENEDIVVQLDRTLADLFKFIDKHVGLNKTLIVLSADHGMADMPEYMSELGLPVSRIYSEDIADIANHAGKKLFGIDEITKLFYRPSLYLDQKKIQSANLDPIKVEKAIAQALTDHKAIALAVPRSGLNDMQSTHILEMVKRNYHPQRSGDIYVVQQPYWFMFEKGPIAAMHGSPWKYDTHVPIIFAGPNIKPNNIHRPVHPVDVAPTLSAILGITPPSSTAGNPLIETLP